MRVAHVITRLILGGAQENTVFNCVDLLRDYGDDVLLITGPPLGPEGSLVDAAQRGGVPLHVIEPLRRAIHPLRDWASYRQVRRVLTDYRPDVVHTHSAKGGIIGRAAAWSLGVPAVIHTVHGAPFYAEQGAALRVFSQAAEKWAARRCHALISVADAMTDLLVAAGVAPRSKFTTIYSGMDVEPLLAADAQRAAVRRRLGFDAADVVVGKVARLAELKGHEYLIAAARQIAQHHPRLRFLLVGDGALRASLQRQLAAAGLAERFLFTGLVPPEEIPGLISAMDIVVHTSLREGLARVLPQALIAGRPVISYDVDGAREVVLPGVTGYLLPPKSIEPLAAALVELSDDAELRRRLGAEGRRRFQDVFRHQQMTAAIRRLYTDVLASTSAPCPAS